MKRLWPEELNFILEGGEPVLLDVPAAERTGGSHGEATQRDALRVRLSQQDYESIWPLAETRYRLQGKLAGKAVTLITNNPHYHQWHPADGGTTEATSDSGTPYKTRYVVVHFLVDKASIDAAVA